MHFVNLRRATRGFRYRKVLEIAAKLHGVEERNSKASTGGGAQPRPA